MKQFLGELLEGAFEGGAPFGLLTGLGGGIYGAIQGWSLLPPETLNILQAALAFLGLVAGAILGFLAGVIAINAFWFGLLGAAILAFLSWLFSN